LWDNEDALSHSRRGAMKDHCIDLVQHRSSNSELRNDVSLTHFWFALFEERNTGDR
jgi:hypothetical protein